MSEPVVLESNQNHATITDNGICPTLSAAMGLGGGYVPMVVVEVEEYGYAAEGICCEDRTNGGRGNADEVEEAEE